MSKIQVRFGMGENIEQPTFVLADRNGDRIGALFEVQELKVGDSTSSPSEVFFIIYKDICPQWDNVDNFKLIWAAEWDMWFELKVTLNQKDASMKFIIATHLPEAELSQLNLYGTEINTDDDIDREGSEATVFFNAKNQEASLLHRVMKKAVNFEIAHVDPSLCNIQRTFTFDKKTIYDALMEIAEEVHCHFEFGTYMDKDRNLIRTVSAYDLESNCNECGHRGEFTNKCPECGSKDITEGYGEDTTIFFSVENALDEVIYSTNVDAVKNCFKLETGDEDMTAAVINCNPAGSDTIWYISDEMKKGMSDGLVSKLDGYNAQYNYYHDEKEYGADLPVEGFNELVSKYIGMNQNKDGMELVPPYIYAPDNGFKLISLPVTGYQALSNIYYDTFDLELFLQSGLMPYVSMAGDDTSAEGQAGLLSSSIKTVAVANIDIASEATVKSSVLSMAKAIVDARYKVEVTQSSYNNKIWAGNLLLTSYSDEDDTCETGTISVTVNGDYGTFIKQKIEKTLSKSDGNSYDIVSLFDLQLDDFKKELTRYGLHPLENFRNSCEAVLSILQEQGVGNPSSYDANSNPSVGDIIDVNLYEEIYVPYYQKQLAIEAEIAVREDEINVAIDMQEAIGKIRNDIKKALDMETFLGEKLWKELNAFRREDVYSNSNYVSDGLSNYEIFQKAEEFFETANKELVRSATLQHSIKVQLRNIFTIREFAPMRKGFAVGNWLRVGVDGTVYKLRLLTYELDYDNYKSMDVEFSDVEKVTNNVTKIRDVLKSARSMASTYSYVERQASQGSESYSVMTGWVNKGLDATAVNIMNNAESQDVVFGSYGLLCRKYDDILGTYDPEQLKIINSTLAITKNRWETVETAIGRIIYYDPVEKVLKEAYGVNAQVLVGKLILGEELGIYNSSGSLTFNQNGLKVSNDTHDIIIDPNAASLFTITKKGDDGDTNLLSFNDDGNLEIVGDIYAVGGKIGGWDITDNAIYHTSAVWGDENGKYFGTDGLSIKNNFTVDANGNLSAKNANIIGNITTSNLQATGGKIANFTISGGYLFNGISIGTAGSCGISCGTSLGGNDDWIFWAGNGVFRVNKNGQAWLTNATITGDITATNIMAKDRYQLYSTVDTSKQIETVIENDQIGFGDGGRSISIGLLSKSPYARLRFSATSGGSNIGILSNTLDLNASNEVSIYTPSLSITATSGISIDSPEFKIASDATGEYFRSQLIYDRTYDKAPNVYVTQYGTLGRSTSSSKKYKHDINNLDITKIEKLYNLPIHTFKYNSDYISKDSERYNKDTIGFIVEELDEILPIAVDHLNGEPEMWNSQILIPCLLKLIQNNKKEIECNRKEIRILRSIIDSNKLSY